MSVIKTYSLPSLSRPSYFLGGGDVSLYSHEGINQMGSGIFPIKDRKIQVHDLKSLFLNKMEVVISSEISGLYVMGPKPSVEPRLCLMIANTLEILYVYSTIS